MVQGRSWQPIAVYRVQFLQNRQIGYTPARFIRSSAYVFILQKQPLPNLFKTPSKTGQNPMRSKTKPVRLNHIDVRKKLFDQKASILNCLLDLIKLLFIWFYRISTIGRRWPSRKKPLDTILGRKSDENKCPESGLLVMFVFCLIQTNLLF